MAIDIPTITELVASAGGLGTAAYGLVDAGKAFSGGISNAGFKAIRKMLDRLLGRTGGPGAFGMSDVVGTLYSNWINGVAIADQKATAKSLIRLSLTPANAPGLAWAVGLDPAGLTGVAQKIQNGIDLVQQDVNVLGRFDATVSALLDEAYEKADQQYRNWSKFTAAMVAIILASVAGGVIFSQANPGGPLADYFHSQNFLIAILIGAVSTPLAPIAKDLSSTIQAAATAVSAWKK